MGNLKIISNIKRLTCVIYYAALFPIKPLTGRDLRRGWLDACLETVLTDLW